VAGQDRRGGDLAVLHVQPFIRLAAGDMDAIAAEGGRLLGFVVSAAAQDVRFAPVG
jgi:hypothetical protein